MRRSQQWVSQNGRQRDRAVRMAALLATKGRPHRGGRRAWHCDRRRLRTPWSARPRWQLPDGNSAGSKTTRSAGEDRARAAHRSDRSHRVGGDLLPIWTRARRDQPAVDLCGSAASRSRACRAACAPARARTRRPGQRLCRWTGSRAAIRRTGDRGGSTRTNAAEPARWTQRAGCLAGLPAALRAPCGTPTANGTQRRRSVICTEARYATMCLTYSNSKG